MDPEQSNPLSPGGSPLPDVELASHKLLQAGTFYQVGQILASSLDLPTKLERVVDLAVRLLGADRGSIFLLDERRDQLQLVASRGVEPDFANKRVGLGEGISGWVAAHRKPLILHDVISDRRFQGIDPKIKSALAIPLMVEDRLIGVLNVSTLSERRFDSEDLEYLSAFADLGAIAIENALLYHDLQRKQEELDKELSLASRIQKSIIAKYVPCAAVKVIARLMPASAVGGDFYSIIPLAKDSRFCFYCSPRIQDRCEKLRSEFCPNKFGIVIGDVANKGLPAALIMAVLTTSLYELGKHHSSPKIILSEANYTFRRCFQESQYNFATLFYGFFDGTNNSFTYSKGGHDAPLLVRFADGKILQLEAEGYPLGLKEDGEYEERTVSLNKGDRLILFTDGLTGALNSRGELYGRRRFIDFVMKHRKHEIETFLDHLIDEIMIFTGDASQPDDIAILVMDLEEEYDLTMTISTDVGEIRSVIDNVLATLEEMDGIKDPIKDPLVLRLCLEELIHNAMEHGNRNDPARKVYITLKKEGSRAFIKVRDEGPGFDYRELREREQEEEDLLSVRGRGLRIVQYYAESIIFNREGNEVTLVLLLK